MIRLLLLLVAFPLLAQPLQRGDVLVSTFRPTGASDYESKIVVYREGVFVRDLAVRTDSLFRETLALPDGSVLAATDDDIQRITGTTTTVFSQIFNPIYLSPTLSGDVVGTTGSKQPFRLASDGSIRSFRDTVIAREPGGNGIDVGPDQCTAYYFNGGAIIAWNSCQNTAPIVLGSPAFRPADSALRLLADGTFLGTYRVDTARFDSQGRTLRTYGIPGAGLGLDVDGTSFWVGAQGSLVRVDIATGAILSNTPVGAAVEYISVVGEPRAALQGAQPASIPTFHTFAFVLMAFCLFLVALRSLV